MPRFAAFGVTLDFCHTSNVILTFSILRYQDGPKYAIKPMLFGAFHWRHELFLHLHLYLYLPHNDASQIRHSRSLESQRVSDSLREPQRVSESLKYQRSLMLFEIESLSGSSTGIIVFCFLITKRGRFWMPAFEAFLQNLF